MPNSNSLNKVNLHPRSKQIKKHNVITRVDNNWSPTSSDSSDKKYKTYTKSQKVNIISDLRKALLANSHSNSSPPDHLINRLQKVNKDKYNQLIESILSSHAPSALKYKGDKKQWQKELKQWRRMLKSWIKNIDKPETRGNTRVIPQAKETEFRQKIIDILQTLPNRSFELLREKALDALKEMHENGNSDEEDPRCVVNDSTFSKHFWYDYLRANPEIDDLYSALPICRNTAKKAIFREQEVIPKAKEDQTEGADCLFETNTQESEAPLLEDVSQFEEYCRYFAEEGLFSEETCFSTSQTTAAMGIPEEEKEDSNDQTLMSLDATQTFSAEKRVFDFYKDNKMIVETEDSEVQKEYFRQFCLNGIEIEM